MSVACRSEELALRTKTSTTRPSKTLATEGRENPFSRFDQFHYYFLKFIAQRSTRMVRTSDLSPARRRIHYPHVVDRYSCRTPINCQSTDWKGAFEVCQGIQWQMLTIKLATIAAILTASFRKTLHKHRQRVARPCPRELLRGTLADKATCATSC
jgi:hypothetical protein